MPKDYLNPPQLPNWSESFSQVVVVHAETSRTIYISGQVSVDEENRVIGRGDLAAQSEQAFSNLASALQAAGAAVEDVVRLGIYIKDYRREQAGIIRETLREVFPGNRLPAGTWLGVQSLALDDLLIEVEATAVVELG